MKEDQVPVKVLGICGSPRRGGNTETLLDKALEGASSGGAECEKIILSDLKIAPIGEKEYEETSNEGFSIVDDDMQLIYRKIKEADVLMVASPVFFGSLSAQTKTMIDRFQCVWLARNIRKIDPYPDRKEGAFLCAGAVERQDFFDNARSIIRHFFATINRHYGAELFCPGLDKKGAAQKSPDYLKKAYELGKQLVSS
jgi:multimeric flavodoxin WrbA